MSTASRPKARGRHLSFRTLGQILPPNGSREARCWKHLLRCEHCADAALVILQGPGERPGPGAYDEAFARAEAKATAAHCLNLAGLHRAQGRLDENLGLLLRAADLYRRAGDDTGAREALAAADEVEALLKTARR